LLVVVLVCSLCGGGVCGAGRVRCIVAFGFESSQATIMPTTTIRGANPKARARTYHQSGPLLDLTLVTLSAIGSEQAHFFKPSFTYDRRSSSGRVVTQFGAFTLSLKTVEPLPDNSKLHKACPSSKIHLVFSLKSQEMGTSMSNSSSGIGSKYVLVLNQSIVIGGLFHVLPHPGH